MKIRNAKKGNKEEVIKLVKGLYLRSARLMVKERNKNYEKNINNILLAIVHKKVVGYVYFSPKKDSLYIEDLYVLPKYRGKKIASKLLKKTERYKRKLNKKHLRVDVRKKDKPAVNLYTKHKFKFLKDKSKNSLKLIK